MNPANLPFDAETMLQGLRNWVECESPTWDANAVNTMLDLAAREMALSGATIERIAGRQGFGGCIRARFPHPKFGQPGILIAGHLDTVHPVGTLKDLPFRRDGNRAWGPGIFDMKGGNYLSLEAIRQLIRASFTTPLPITVLFTPDEEVGTPSVRDLIEAEAARNKYVLVPDRGDPPTASSPAAMRSRASIWKRSASRATPARRFRPGVRPSARWPNGSSRSTA